MSIGNNIHISDNKPTLVEQSTAIFKNRLGTVTPSPKGHRTITEIVRKQFLRSDASEARKESFMTDSMECAIKLSFLPHIHRIEGR